jgi:hypothetical protein
MNLITYIVRYCCCLACKLSDGSVGLSSEAFREANACTFLLWPRRYGRLNFQARQQRSRSTNTISHPQDPPYVKCSQIMSSVYSGVSVRLAREGDLSAILALLLTSFRQFPLFDFLYSPLDNDFDVAHDTLFFWRRRLLLDLLDPEAAVIVAEAPLDCLAVSASSGDDDEVYQKSLKAQEWTEKNGLSTKSSSTKGCSIVGFAIWRFRLGEKVGAERSPEKIRRSWYNECRARMIGWEVELWKWIYQRQDQEPTRFAAYIESEDELGKRFALFRPTCATRF